jgi:D-alanyl-D-alanine carboxypeptidase
LGLREDTRLPNPLDYQERVNSALADLGIPVEVIRKRRFPLCVETGELVVAEIDSLGREHRLMPAAADAWKKMKAAAHEDGIEMQIVSAFRSFDQQVDIIRRKIEAGHTIDEILSVSAPPGYSEHHTGCAVDLGTSGCDSLEEVFEQSQAFSWLAGNAARYRFFMSFPRDNAYGYRNEPWHWAYRKT